MARALTLFAMVLVGSAALGGDLSTKQVWPGLLAAGQAGDPRSRIVDWSDGGTTHIQCWRTFSGEHFSLHVKVEQGSKVAQESFFESTDGSVPEIKEVGTQVSLRLRSGSLLAMVKLPEMTASTKTSAINVPPPPPLNCPGLPADYAERVQDRLTKLYGGRGAVISSRCKRPQHVFLGAERKSAWLVNCLWSANPLELRVTEWAFVFMDGSFYDLKDTDTMIWDKS